jgi:hypothetical protein
MKLAVAFSVAFSCVSCSAASFGRFFVVTFENADYADVAADKYFQTLAGRGLLLTNQHGVTHPSQPNYLAMIAGSDFGVNTDLNVDLVYVF